jgi:hypothetical protein
MNLPLPGVDSLIDIVIAITLLEALALATYHAKTGGGISPKDFVPTLAAGLALMLAVRAGVSGAGWGWVAVALLASGLAHLADVRRRWR